MMPLNLLRLQLMETFIGHVRITVRFGVTLLLALPFIFVNMPARAKASGMVMVILFTTFFGTAIAHARLCEAGRFTRLRMLPMSRPLLWLDLILAALVGRIVPAAVLLTCFILVNASAVTFSALLYIAGLLCTAVLGLVAVATFTGQLCRSNGQVHLVGALACGVIAFVSGLVPPAVKLTPLTGIMAANPLFRLQTALEALSGGTPFIPAAASAVCSIIFVLVALAVILRWTVGTVPNKQLTDA